MITFKRRFDIAGVLEHCPNIKEKKSEKLLTLCPTATVEVGVYIEPAENPNHEHPGSRRRYEIHQTVTDVALSALDVIHDTTGDLLSIADGRDLLLVIYNEEKDWRDNDAQREIGDYEDAMAEDSEIERGLA